MLLHTIVLFCLRGKPLHGATEKLRALCGAQLNVRIHEVEPDVTSEQIWATFLAAKCGQVAIDTTQRDLLFVADDLRKAYQFQPLVPTFACRDFAYLRDVTSVTNELERGELEGHKVVTFGWGTPSADMLHALRVKYGNFALSHHFDSADMTNHVSALQQMRRKEMSENRTVYVLFNRNGQQRRETLRQTDQILKGWGVPLLAGADPLQPRCDVVAYLECDYRSSFPAYEQGNGRPTERPKWTTTRIDYL